MDLVTTNTLEQSVMPAVELENTTTRSWQQVANDVWTSRSRAPKYPKRLTENEIIAQATTTFRDDRPEKLIGWVPKKDGQPGEQKQVTREVPRGIGLLMRLTLVDEDKVYDIYRQFEEFIYQVSFANGASPWSSWRQAWADFADYAGLNTVHHKTAMIKEGIA